MLVTVFIIAVLIALLLPVSRSFIAKGAAITCANHMRQLGTALFASRGDNNGWFPPGYPVRAGAIKKIDQMPGMPDQPGMSGNGFNISLVNDGYLDQLPVCPLAQLDPKFRAANPSPKKYFQKQGGTYAINGLLLQTKIEAMPPQWWYPVSQAAYKSSNMGFLFETAWGGVTWAFSHCNQALEGLWYGPTGTGTRVTMPRNHGHGNMLNFMFLDQHIELVGRNDVGSNNSWWYTVNPKARFYPYASGNALIGPSTVSDNTFQQMYPQFFPPP